MSKGEALGFNNLYADERDETDFEEAGEHGMRLAGEIGARMTRIWWIYADFAEFL